MVGGVGFEGKLHLNSLEHVWRFESYDVETCLELLACRGAESAVAMEVQIRHADEIRSLRFLADLNFMEAQPELVRALRGRFGDDCVVEWKAHSKFLCLTGGAFDVLLLGSMNLHANKRFKYFTVVGGSSVAASYLKVVDDLLLNPPRVRRFSRDGLARELPV